MADAKYTIFITGSNAKMLSGEINTTLGGRFLIAEVYPYSFKEFLAVHQVPFGEIDLLATEGRDAFGKPCGYSTFPHLWSRY